MIPCQEKQTSSTLYSHIIFFALQYHINMSMVSLLYSHDDCEKLLIYSTLYCYPSPQQKTANNFLETEAEVSHDGDEVSSDETDCEGELDSSFVDDCTQLSQDPAVELVHPNPIFFIMYICS